jgi:hypothetical protein
MDKTDPDQLDAAERARPRCGKESMTLRNGSGGAFQATRTTFVFLALVVSVGGGCAPQIRQFAVMPHHICLGTAVTATWDADGHATLATEPPLGSQQAPWSAYVPATDTTFTLTVTQWPHKPKVSQTAVTVFTTMQSGEGAEDEIPFQLQCTGRALNGTLDRPLDGWDARLTVTKVASDESRVLMVEHEGLADTLTPEHPTTDAFGGTHLGGYWYVSTPLPSGERCGDPTAPPPDLITMTVGVACR